MAKSFRVSFRCVGSKMAFTNFAHAATERDVANYYIRRKCSVIDVEEVAEAELVAAQNRGTPIIEA